MSCNFTKCLKQLSALGNHKEVRVGRNILRQYWNPCVWIRVSPLKELGVYPIGQWFSTGCKLGSFGETLKIQKYLGVTPKDDDLIGLG